MLGPPIKGTAELDFMVRNIHYDFSNIQFKLTDVHLNMLV